MLRLMSSISTVQERAVASLGSASPIEPASTAGATVELHQRDGESWLGLAASYDRLKRFDLADRAYAQAIKIVGATPEILNNQGFSYMLRGDYRRARVTFLEAQSRAPDNPYIKNNLDLLEESVRTRRAVR